MKLKTIDDPLDTFDVKFPENQPFDVVGFGTNSVDQLCVIAEYPRRESKTEILQYERLPGGQVATAIKFLARMGLRAKYVGKVGGDDSGLFCLQELRADRIDIGSVLIEQDAKNQFAVILIDGKSGERTIFSKRDSHLNFKASELNEEIICAGRLLHLDGYDSESALQSAAWCQKRQIPIVMDLDTVVPNCQELIENVDFLIVSSNFPCELTGKNDLMEAFRELRHRYAGFLAMTLGSKGSIAWVGNQCFAFPGLKIKACDTTGAGDIFHGAFIYGLLQNWPIKKIMDFSNTAAGLSCMSLGAQTGIRPYHEILQHLNSHELNPCSVSLGPAIA
jgi:sulfofructose kinase